MGFPSDEDDEEETERAYTGRTRRPDGLAMLDDDDDLDAGETTLPLEMPTGLCPFPLSSSGPRSITREAAHHSYPRVRMGEGLHHATATGADAPELRLQGANRANRCYAQYEAPPYTAVDEAAAEGALMLLNMCNALSRMLQRELLAAPQGAGRGDIDRDGGPVCGKEGNEEEENADEDGRKESWGGGEDGYIEGSGLEEDISSGSDRGHGGKLRQRGGEE